MENTLIAAGVALSALGLLLKFTGKKNQGVVEDFDPERTTQSRRRKRIAARGAPYNLQQRRHSKPRIHPDEPEAGQDKLTEVCLKDGRQCLFVMDLPDQHIAGMMLQRLLDLMDKMYLYCRDNKAGKLFPGFLGRYSNVTVKEALPKVGDRHTTCKLTPELSISRLSFG